VDVTGGRLGAREDGDEVEAWSDDRDAETESTVEDGDEVEAWSDDRDAETESTIEKAPSAGLDARAR
jgi:hypothetical protein